MARPGPSKHPCVTDCNHNNEGLGNTGAHECTGKEKENISKALCVRAAGRTHVTARGRIRLFLMETRQNHISANPVRTACWFHTA